MTSLPSSTASILSIALLGTILTACTSTSPEGTAERTPSIESPAESGNPAAPSTADRSTEGRSAEVAASARDVVELAPGVRVDRDAHSVELDGIISIQVGLLEQIACARGTREHESIFVPSARPSTIHAALLLAGFDNGKPGRWSVDAQGNLVLAAPTGDEVEILLRVETPEFRPIERFVRNAVTGTQLPKRPFHFAGSRFAPNPPSFGPGEHYVADYTGSIVGLVTFGDEVIGWHEVIPDLAEVAEPAWEANPAVLPAPGTPATLLLRRPDPSSR